LPIKVGILGYGYMGKWHHNHIDAIEGACVTEACDILPERLDEAKQRGLKICSDATELLADNLDLVIVATPNNLHKQLSIQALRAGRNVLCEKPVTMNVAQLDEVLDAAADSGMLFTTHQNRRWDMDYLVICEAIQKGTIGKPITIESRVMGERGIMFGWRGEPEFGGGMLLDWGPHLVDQLLTLNRGNKVKTVFAQVRSILTPHVDDYCILELLFQNGMNAHVELGTFSLVKQPRWFVYGDKGTLMVENFTGKSGEIAKIKVNGSQQFEFQDNSTGPSRTLKPLSPECIEKCNLPELQGNAYAFYDNLFLAIQGREDLTVSHQDMRRCMQVIDSAFQSSKEQRSLDVDI
jgi:scyllo-inositol 2-dehydrogenase (NADP+)